MKILLQDRTTELYARSADWWTNEPREALAFRSIASAARYIHDHHLESVRVLAKPGPKEKPGGISEIEFELPT
jgi:hypothetical protein